MEKKSPIEDLRNALIEDEGYYISWQANLAMAFQDAFHRMSNHYGVHTISNIAAKNFLEQLCLPARIPHPSVKEFVEKVSTNEARNKENV